MDISSEFEQLKEYAAARAATESVETVGFVYYGEQWRQFAKVVKDWEDLVAKSPLLMDLNNRRHYQEMVKDMHSVSVMAHYRGDKAKEHEILCAACKRLLRHLGRREARVGYTLYAHILLDDEAEKDVFAPCQEELEQLFKRCRPRFWQRWTGLYNRRARMQMLAEGVARVYSGILNDFVKMLHVDYSYDDPKMAKVLLFGTRRWMEELWEVVLHPEKAVPFDGTRERIRSFADPPLPAEKMVRDCFFSYYWQETHPYNDRLKEQVHQHMLAAQKLWADLKKCRPAVTE